MNPISLPLAGGSRWLGWLAGLAVLVAGGSLLGAVSASTGERLRAAIRLPEVGFTAQLGSSWVLEWHGDGDIPDAAVRLAELRQKLQGRSSDAPLLLRIAEVTSLNGSETETATAYRAALEAARRWTQESPDSAEAKVQLAGALMDAKGAEEAGRILRPLTGEGSRNGAAFLRLAELHLVLGTLAWETEPMRGMSILAGRGTSPSAAEHAKATREYRLARAAADRAVELRPDDPWPLLRRARLQAKIALLEACMKPQESQERRGVTVASLTYAKEALPDLRAALRLRPEDPRLLTAIVAHECAAEMGRVWKEGGDSPGTSALLKRLSEDSQERVRSALARLEKLGDSSEPRVAATALEGLAILRMMLGLNSSEMQKIALRAYRLDPTRGPAFEMVIAGLAGAKEPDWGLMESLLRQRMKTRDEARLRLTLAKAQDQRSGLTPAVETVVQARKDFPDSVPLVVAEFALRLKKGDLKEESDAIPYLEEITRGLARMPDGPEKGLLNRRLFITVVIANALEGRVGIARQRIREYIARVPDDSYALAVDQLLREIPASEQ